MIKCAIRIFTHFFELNRYISSITHFEAQLIQSDQGFPYMRWKVCFFPIVKVIIIGNCRYIIVPRDITPLEWFWIISNTRCSQIFWYACIMSNANNYAYSLRWFAIFKYRKRQDILSIRIIAFYCEEVIYFFILCVRKGWSLYNWINVFTPLCTLNLQC